MDPMLKLKSMKIAAELLCCAQQGSGGSGSVFPTTQPVGHEGEIEYEWNDFLEAFFEISDRIAQKLNE